MRFFLSRCFMQSNNYHTTFPHSSISVTAQVWLIFTRYASQRNGNGFLDLPRAPASEKTVGG